MSISNHPHIVINPASAGGRTAKLQTAILQHIEGRIGKTYSLCITQKPTDAMRSVAEALESGRTHILVVGGDGTGVVIGNGPITAGGMQLTPNAVLNDGALDLLIIQEQSVLQRIRSFSRIYNGRHVFLPTFESLKGRSVRIESEGLVNGTKG